MANHSDSLVTEAQRCRITFSGEKFITTKIKLQTSPAREETGQNSWHVSDSGVKLDDHSSQLRLSITNHKPDISIKNGAGALLLNVECLIALGNWCIPCNPMPSRTFSTYP